MQIKISRLMLLVVLLVGLMPGWGAAGAEGQEYGPSRPGVLPPETGDVRTIPLDTSQSLVQWRLQRTHGRGYHNGSLKITDGNVMVSNGELVGGSLTVDMNSLESLELQGLANGMMADRLRTLAAQDHPEAELVMAEVRKEGQDYEVTADLTLRGETRRVSFPLQVTKLAGSDFAATARFDIDREQWGLAYGQGSPLREMAEQMMGDNVEVRLVLRT